MPRCCIKSARARRDPFHSRSHRIRLRKRQYRAGLYTFGDIEQLLAECGVIVVTRWTLWFRLDGMVRDLAFDELDTSTVSTRSSNH